MKGKTNIVVQEFEQTLIDRHGIRAVATVRVVTESKRPLKRVDLDMNLRVEEA